jgi:hypothetical protein
MIISLIIPACGIIKLIRNALLQCFYKVDKGNYKI